MNTELASLSNDFDLTIAYTIPKLSFLHTELSLLDQDVLESVINDQPQWKSYIQKYYSSKKNHTSFILYKKSFLQTLHQHLVSLITITGDQV